MLSTGQVTEIHTGNACMEGKESTQLLNAHGARASKEQGGDLPEGGGDGCQGRCYQGHSVAEMAPFLWAVRVHKCSFYKYWLI